MDNDRQARDRDVTEAFNLDPNDPDYQTTLDEIEDGYQAAGGVYVLAWTDRPAETTATTKPR